MCRRGRADDVITDEPVAGVVAADDVDLDEVDRIVASTGRTQRAVIPILRRIQERFNYLPEPALRRVAATTQITPATVEGVASFYAQFRRRPAGRHTIKVCIGTACHVKGADAVFDAFKRHLRIPAGEDTDRERLFTVDKVACLGCCMLAPAVQIDDVTYGFVEPAKVGAVVKDFVAAQDAVEEAGGEAPAGPLSGEVRLCCCSSCLAAGAGGVRQAFRRGAADLRLGVVVTGVGCTGVSYQAPLVEVVMDDGRAFRYGRVAPDDARPILLRHFRPAGVSRRVKSRMAALIERVLTDEAWEPVTRFSVDLRSGPDALYVGRQKHVVTEHCGEFDPSDVAAYRAHGGFRALERCVRELAPRHIVETIRRSGLRGRGGAGFSTAAKWETVASAAGAAKVVICNGDEGDPGAFMDRMLLESFPFRVIEGIAIAARAVGATEGFIYVRAEYPLAMRRLEDAIRVCRAEGILGDRVLGGSVSLELRVVEGAGAFVCGEETALIAAIEGRRGMPRVRPPYPSERGLDGRPTLVNNVETFAAVPWIVRNGADAFAAVGSGTSKGTKAFALAGKIVRGGLIEIPMGVSLRAVVEDIGGGIQGGRAVKAVQIGGPSGGCVPADMMDTAIDYEALTQAGAIMGSGGLVVLDETDCMVDIARYFMTFTQRESCGKCTYCRVGTKRMLEILERLCSGDGREGDIEQLEHLGDIVGRGSLCGLGQTAPNPVISTLRYFRDEYDAHVRKRCPALKCRALVRYAVTDDCIGCTRCAQRCPSDAIATRPYEKHEIDEEKCTRCDTCRQVCPADAVKVES